MIILPTEILLLIFDELSYPDFKNLRRVSRRLSRVAATYQYRRIVLYDPRGQKRIKLANETLGPYLGKTK